MHKAKKQKIKSNKKGNIRVIAGKYGGRKLPVVNAEGLRPTTDRVKETVFNWLMPYINDSVCLDCFAGSGGLGFEALSRGAEQVTFLELDKQASQQLKENAQLLKVENCTIECTNSLDYIEANNNQYNIVFIDPPFRKNFITKTTSLLTSNCLTDGAIIYLEMEVENNTDVLPSSWQLLKEKIAGQVVYRLYQYNKN